ncbi:helix-turn-helix transcriptional regulator [Paenibacillus sp. GCM10027626]|uniref:helix-turn-helix transcriptional regulator n=1 Tax=Paenibacillus sp. GCM10027626 TaxID=3273411 RepID=UPI00362873A9
MKSNVVAIGNKLLIQRQSDSGHSERSSAALLNLEHGLQSPRAGHVSGLLRGMVLLEKNKNETAINPGLVCSSCSVLIVRLKRASAGKIKLAVQPDICARLAAMARRLAEQRQFVVIDSVQNGELVLVSLFPKMLTVRDVHKRLNYFCVDFIETMRREYSFVCCIAVSPNYKRLQDLDQAFQEAAALMESSFFRSGEPVLFPDGSKGADHMGQFSILRDLEQFYQKLDYAGSQEIDYYLGQLLERIAAYCAGNILVAKGLLLDIGLGTARYYFRATGDEFGLDYRIDEMTERIYSLSSMQEAAAYLQELVYTVKCKLEADDKEYSLVVKKAVDYINSHFAENINLTIVADYLGLSSGYLSRLLRAETGINFVDLVSTVRIEAAKRLLMDPKYKVNEVGELVGYKEYAYFYQVFKKIEGLSPKEYKNKSREI